MNVSETPAPRANPDTYYPADGNEFGRGVSFFDAIYGFSATLLIANVDAPPGEAWSSVQTLLDAGVGTQLYGFVLSFVVIAVFWRANVRIVRDLTGLDGPTMTANLIATGLVILIPFTSQGISDPASEDFALPTAFYALNIALAALAQIGVSMLGRFRGLQRTPLGGRAYLLDTVSAWLTPAVFAASIPIALAAGPAAGQWTWLSLAFLLPVFGRAADKARRASSA